MLCFFFVVLHVWQCLTALEWCPNIYSSNKELYYGLVHTLVVSLLVKDTINFLDVYTFA